MVKIKSDNLILHFVDVGAHTGRTSKKILQSGGDNTRVWMFEPNAILALSLIADTQGDSRAVVYAKAFTDKEGRADMYTPDKTSESSSLYADKKTSIGSPVISVPCIDGVAFLKKLSPGPIVLYSNCEGSEFDFIPKVLDDKELRDRIVFWSVSFHHGQRKIPSMKPTYLKIKARMDELGIENVIGHYGNRDIREGKLDEFVKEVLTYAPKNS